MKKIIIGATVIVGLFCITLLIDNYMSTEEDNQISGISLDVLSYLNKERDFKQLSSKEINQLENELEGIFVEYYDIQSAIEDTKVLEEGVYEDINGHEVSSTPEEVDMYKYDINIETGEFILKEEYRTEEVEEVLYGQDLDLTVIDGKDHIRIDDIEYKGGYAYINYNGYTYDLNEIDLPLQRKKYEEARDMKFTLDSKTLIETTEGYEYNLLYLGANGVKVNISLNLTTNFLKEVEVESMEVSVA